MMEYVMMSSFTWTGGWSRVPTRTKAKMQSKRECNVHDRASTMLQ